MTLKTSLQQSVNIVLKKHCEIRPITLLQLYSYIRNWKLLYHPLESIYNNLGKKICLRNYKVLELNKLDLSKRRTLLNLHSTYKEETKPTNNSKYLSSNCCPKWNGRILSLDKHEECLRNVSEIL